MEGGTASSYRAGVAVSAEIAPRRRVRVEARKRRSGSGAAEGTARETPFDCHPERRAPAGSRVCSIPAKSAKSTKFRPVIRAGFAGAGRPGAYPETGKLAPNPAAFPGRAINHVQVEKRESDQWEDSVRESSSGCSTRAWWLAKAASCCSAGDSTKRAEGILRTQNSGLAPTEDRRPQDLDFAAALRSGRPTSQVIDSCQATHDRVVANRHCVVAREPDWRAAFRARQRPVSLERGARGGRKTGLRGSKGSQHEGPGRRSGGPDGGCCGASSASQYGSQLGAWSRSNDPASRRSNEWPSGLGRVSIIPLCETGLERDGGAPVAAYRARHHRLAPGCADWATAGVLAKRRLGRDRIGNPALNSGVDPEINRREKPPKICVGGACQNGVGKVPGGRFVILFRWEVAGDFAAPCCIRAAECSGNTGARRAAPSIVIAISAAIHRMHSGADRVPNFAACLCLDVRPLRQIRAGERCGKSGSVESAPHGGAARRAAKSEYAHSGKATEIAEVSEGAVAVCGDTRNGKRLDKSCPVEINSDAAAQIRPAVRKWVDFVEALNFGATAPALKPIRTTKRSDNSGLLAESRCVDALNHASELEFSRFRSVGNSRENSARIALTFAPIRKGKRCSVFSPNTKSRCAAGASASFDDAQFCGPLKLNGFSERVGEAQKHIQGEELFATSCPDAKSRCAAGIYAPFGGGAIYGLFKQRGFSGQDRKGRKHIRKGELFDTSCPGSENAGARAVDLTPYEGDRKPFIFSEFSGIVRACFGAPKHIRRAELFRTFGPGVSGEFSDDFASEDFAVGEFWAVNSGECLTEINAEKLPDFSKSNSHLPSSESITGISSGRLPDVVIPDLSESITGINAQSSRESACINSREAFTRINRRAGDSPFEQTRLADSPIRAFPVRAGPHAGCASAYVRAPP